MSLRILIVEDDVYSRQLMHVLMSRAGHDSFGVETVAEAIDTIDKIAPDWVILDLSLPDKGGIEVLRYVRDKGLPIKVAVTTGMPKDYSDLVMSLSPDAFLQKPISIKELYGLVNPEAK